jgi:hypothetical protein
LIDATQSGKNVDSYTRAKNVEVTRTKIGKFSRDFFEKKISAKIFDFELEFLDFENQRGDTLKIKEEIL